MDKKSTTGYYEVNRNQGKCNEKNNRTATF